MFGLKIGVAGLAAILAGLMVLSMQNPAIAGAAWKGPVMIGLGIALLVLAARSEAKPTATTAPASAPPPTHRGPKRWLDPRRMAIYSRAFEWETVQTERAEFPVHVEKIGPLTVRTGRIVVFDPTGLNDTTPFEQPVPIGEHSADLLVATHEHGKSVLFARITFSEDEVSEWRMATIPGENTEDLEWNTFFGFGVDGGCGSVADRDVVVVLQNLFDEFGKEWDEFHDHVVEVLEGPFPDVMGATYSVETMSCPVFWSGEGDGRYPCYFGLSANGDVCQLVIDFNLVDPDLNVDKLPES